MTQRLLLLTGSVAASVLVLALVMLSEADARACMEWDGGLHVGYDDDARPFSTTWAAFGDLLRRDLREPRGAFFSLVVCSLTFLPFVLGGLAASRQDLRGLWIGLSLTVAVAAIVLGDPGAHHDCDRKGSDVIFLVMFLGPVVGLLCTAVGLVAVSRVSRR